MLLTIVLNITVQVVTRQRNLHGLSIISLHLNNTRKLITTASWVSESLQTLDNSLLQLQIGNIGAGKSEFSA
jgi:hypothetical protein